MVQIKKLNIWVYSKNGDINDAVDRSIVWKFVRNTWTPKFLSSLVIRCPSPSQNILVNCYLKRLVTRDSQLRDPDEEEENLLIGGDNVKVCKQKSDSPSTQFQGCCSKTYTERDWNIPSKPITAR